MGIKDGFKNFCLRMDMLCASPILRVKGGESDFETLCGGLFSLVIMLAFAGIFYSSFLSVVDKLEIDYSSNMADDTESESTVTDVQFAIGIDGVDFATTPWKFQVKVKQKEIEQGPGGHTATASPIALSPCQRSDWADLGENFDKQFDGFGFNSMLCLSPSTDVELFGYSGEVPYKYLELQIEKCTTSQPSCDTTANVNSYMTNYELTNNYFNVRFFIVNTILSPNKEQPVSKMIQKNIMMTYSSSTGTVGYVYIGDYSIQTDQSVWPLETWEELTGSFLDQFTTSTVPLSAGATTMVQFYLYKSTKTITVSRTYGKIDEFLSYVGGLFSLLFTVIAFFFASYSQYSYQLYIGEHTATLDKSGRRLREQDVNFCTYFFYCIYDWLDFFGCALNSQKMEQIHGVRQEANAQLDAVTILKRLNYLEKASKMLLTEYQQLTLHLATAPTIEQSKKNRELLDFNDKLMKKLQAGRTASPRQVEREYVVEKSENGNSRQERKSSESDQTDDQLLVLFSEALKKLKSSVGEVDLRIQTRILPEIVEYLRDVKERDREKFMNLTENEIKDHFSLEIAAEDI